MATAADILVEVLRDWGVDISGIMEALDVAQMLQFADRVRERI